MPPHWEKDGQTLVGFALETNDETKNAQRKLERKNLDFIVLNSLNDQGAGFRCDTNKITIIDRQGATPYPLKSKQEVARDIIVWLAMQRFARWQAVLRHGDATQLQLTAGKHRDERKLVPK